MTAAGQRVSTNRSSDPSEEREADMLISDFLVQEVGDDEDKLVQLNEFFNSSQIKSELHWFTHRETLERAASRDDRRLYYFAPHEKILGGLMVWCESRVLEPKQAQIRLVAVDPAYREYGIGHYLVATAVDFAQSQGKPEMIADVAAEAPAVRFWQACGFHQADQYETKGGRKMYQMHRDISG